jgi:hypothetical protein
LIAVIAVKGRWSMDTRIHHRGSQQHNTLLPSSTASERLLLFPPLPKKTAPLFDNTKDTALNMIGQGTTFAGSQRWLRICFRLLRQYIYRRSFFWLDE